MGLKWAKVIGVMALQFAALLAPASAEKPARDLEVVPIWPGPPPGTEAWAGPETTNSFKLPGGQQIVMIGNVTTPTLTAYRPAPRTANGTAVIVCPGGGFQNLAILHEGEMVARWLTDRGVTAFVLKYRVRMIPGFKMPADLRTHPERFAEFARSFDSGRPIAIADGIQAMRFLRANASRFGIAPDRIGMMGFSAGAITTLGVILDGTPADRPNFAAPIYGAMIEDKAPPQNAPPLFIAVTQDDNAIPVGQSVDIFSRWTAANLPAELHVYDRGGHGFGMTKHNQPVDDWTVAFEAWLKSHGWIGGTKAP